MKPSRPVDDNVGLSVVESNSSPDRARSIELAKLEESIEHRAVLAHIEALQLRVLMLLKTYGHDHRKWRWVPRTTSTGIFMIN